MQLAVSSYSFTQLFKNGKNQIDIIHTAKEMGFGAIEFVDILPHDGTSRAAYAKRLREACNDLDIKISNYTFGADFLTGSDGNAEKEIERVKQEIDLAEILGASSVRHDATTGYGGTAKPFVSFQKCLPRLAAACREVTVYAQQKGISTMVENHGYFAQDSIRMEQLLDAVNHENFGLLVDMGNFMCADEAPELAVGRLAPYARYVHAKDFLWKSANDPNPGKGFFPTRAGNLLRGTIVGHGVVPVKQCLSILKNAGYDGTVAIEFEGLEPACEALTIGLENLQNYLRD